MKRLLPILLLLLAPCAWATEVTLQWQLQPQDCEGNAMDPSSYDTIEFFVADSPIPASNTSCPGDAGYAVDPRPVGGNVVLTAQSPNALQGDIPVNLLPGTYFARARVSDTDGNWSNLSLELQVDVPQGVLQVPVIIQINI